MNGKWPAIKERSVDCPREERRENDVRRTEAMRASPAGINVVCLVYYCDFVRTDPIGKTARRKISVARVPLADDDPIFACGSISMGVLRDT